MPATIVGELSADESSIVLMAAGAEHDVIHASRQIALCTPLVKQSKPPGALVMAASWPGVVQLASTFGTGWAPGPRLTEWITSQVAARLPDSSPAGLSVTPPPGMVPRSYQVSGAQMISALGRALLFDEAGPQPVTTPILTPEGWTRLGDLAPGDTVYGANGCQQRVRQVKRFSDGHAVYRVTLNDRTSTLATAEHRWHVYTHNERHGNRGGGRVLTTSLLALAGLHGPNGRQGRAAKFFLPQQPVLRDLGNASAELPLDSYVYGALLGDGALGGADLSITCPDAFILDRVEKAAAQLGTSSRRPTGDRCPSVHFHRNGELPSQLADLGAREGAAAKFVHSCYRLASEGVRRSVLAGLLDTDGTVNKVGAGVEFSSASPQLAADVAWLARSLGAVVTESDPQPAGYRNASGERVECLPKHRVLIRFPADGPNPFALPRKGDIWAAAAQRVQRRNPPRTIESIERAGYAEVCCIELDSDDEHVYLTDTALIPTHNTGKTPTTILGLVERAEVAPVLPVVVVCPASVVDPWVETFQNWAPQWRTVAWRGIPARRHALSGIADVYVSSYDTAWRDTGSASKPGPLLRMRPVSVVADESHLLKSVGANRSRASRQLARRASNFVALSGTPITHHPGNLWTTLDALAPTAWPSKERWCNRYLLSIPGDYSETVLGLHPATQEEFRTALLGQYRRVAKADVLTELPPKVYSVRTVELPAEYRRTYDAMEADMLAELPDGTEMSVMGILAQLTRLSQLASAATDVHTTTEIITVNGLDVEQIHQSVTLKAPSWKVDALLEICAERPETSVVAFAPSRQLVMLAGEAAAGAGRRVGYIVGGQSMTERTKTIAAFQSGELDLICATTGAGGVGITLTAASCCVFLQRPWSLVEALQSEDRLHRIGSEGHECIEIIDVLAKNTIDTRVRSVLREKAGQLGDLVQDPRIVAELLGGASVRKLRKAS